MMTTMHRGSWRRPHQVATWALVVVLASVSSVVCVAGSWQTQKQDECLSAMAHSPDSHSQHLDCCTSQTPNFDASLVTIAAVPPPPLMLVAVDLFGARPSAGQLSSPTAPDSSALKLPTTPTYLLDSVFRI